MRSTIFSLLGCGLVLVIFASQRTAAGTVLFVVPVLQLGALTNGQNVSVTFVLTNGSDKVVKIADVDPGCKCTSLRKSPAQISAHGKGTFEFNFNSARAAGSVTESVQVLTEDGQLITGQFHATVAVARTNLISANNP